MTVPLRAIAGAAVALLALFAGCGPRAAAPAAAPVRVLVYNIHAGTDMAGEENLDGVADLVRRTGADLVLLQEVDRGTVRSGGVDQLAELERRTGFHGAFGKTLDYQGGDYGIAVLSRWPILSDTLIPLPVQPAQERAGGLYEPRGALRVRIDGPAGAIGVLNTHLDPARDDFHRLQEIATIIGVGAALRAENPRTVVGGDFNAEPGTRTIDAMLDAGWTDAWSDCGDSAGPTFPADAPIKRIDYLFLSPGLGCESADVIETVVSDHRPVLVVVR